MEFNEKMKVSLEGMGRLPTLPGIAVKILELVKNVNSNINDISDIISSDPSLSAEVLKTVNSALYGLPSKITTVHRAANLLGISTIKNLSLSFSLIKKYRTGNKNFFDYTDFWKKSLTGATASKLLATNIHPDIADDAFFVGLFCDIGILAIVQCMPEQYSLILKEMEKTQCTFHEAERQILGFDHAEISGYLTHQWGFPETFSVPIRYHHQPDQLQDTSDNNIEHHTKFLHLASAYTDFMNHPDKTLRLGLIEHFGETHGFSDKYDIEETILQLQIQTADVFTLFDIEIVEEMDYSEIIEEARKELINLSEDFIGRFVEQQRHIEKLSEMASRDGLTGLINRRRFDELINTEIAKAKQYNKEFSLILADIDYFKKVNDIYGHLAGDWVLKLVSNFLKDDLRTSDIVARYGGEEFGIILSETPEDLANVTIDRLRKRLAEFQFNYEGQKISITLSFGIASFTPGQDIPYLELIRKADSALYEAKRTGRNKCCVFQTQ